VEPSRPESLDYRCFEIQHLLELPWYTVNAQIRHLRREGKIKPKGKRLISTGGYVNVWVQTAEGRKIVIQ
jgi:hypothetical protein